MAIGTPVKAKNVKNGQYVVSYVGKRCDHIGKIVEIKPAPNGRILLCSEWSRVGWLMRPDTIVRVVG